MTWQTFRDDHLWIDPLFTASQASTIRETLRQAYAQSDLAYAMMNEIIAGGHLIQYRVSQKYFSYWDHNLKYTIYISFSESNKYNYITENGYPEPMRIQNIIIHEFAHVALQEYDPEFFIFPGRMTDFSGNVDRASNEILEALGIPGRVSYHSASLIGDLDYGTSLSFGRTIDVAISVGGARIVRSTEQLATSDLIFGRDLQDTTPGDRDFNTNNRIFAGGGNDFLYGFSGNDNIQGQLGDDYIDGGDGNDRLFGNEGADTIFGGEGTDQMIGGTGNDLYVLADMSDRIVEKADEGIDTASFTSKRFVARPHVENYVSKSPEPATLVINQREDGGRIGTITAGEHGLHTLFQKGGHSAWVVCGSGADRISIGREHNLDDINFWTEVQTISNFDPSEDLIDFRRIDIEFFRYAFEGAPFRDLGGIVHRGLTDPGRYLHVSIWANGSSSITVTDWTGTQQDTLVFMYVYSTSTLSLSDILY